MLRYPRVVVIGAGFGGMQAAQSLARSRIEVLLIDRHNYHTFVPLLYQVATAQLEPAQVVYPIRNMVRRSPRYLKFLQAEVQQINFAEKWVKTDVTVVPYDFLVLATGSQMQFLGIPGTSEYALPLRTLEDAVALRNRVLTCLEQATHTVDPAARQALLTFAIVGGGATGVEMAGALVELVRQSCTRDYPDLDLRQVQIILLQAGDRLLPDLPQKLGNYTYRRLRQVGVEVYLGAKVSRVSPGSVRLQTGQSIATETVIWCAGLEAALPDTTTELDAEIRGKLRVRSTLQLTKHPDVYAVGDLAHVVQKGKPLTGVAPEALQQGVTVARNIRRQRFGKDPLPFSYFNKGRLAIIGCYSGVGKIAGFAFAGFLPWLMWLGVHLIYLPGLRNRLYVLLSWLQNYLLGDRAVRVIAFSPESNSLKGIQSAATNVFRDD